MLNQVGKSTGLLILCRFAEGVGARVHRLVEDAVHGLRVDLQCLLKVARSHPLLFDEGSEDRELDHMAQVKMSLPGLKIQLHLNLLHLEVAQELTISWRLANQVVDCMHEADHRLFICDADVQSLAISTNQRNTLPRVPAVLLAVRLDGH